MVNDKNIKKTKNVLFLTFSYIFIGIVIVFTLAPIVYTLLGSFKTNAELTQGGGMNQLASSLSSLEDLKAGLAQIDEAVGALDEGSLKLYKGQKEFKESGMNVLKEKLDLTSQELDTLMSLIREMDAFNEEVKVFAGTPEGSIHTSRFVFKIK